MKHFKGVPSIEFAEFCYKNLFKDQKYRTGGSLHSLLNNYIALHGLLNFFSHEFRSVLSISTHTFHSSVLLMGLLANQTVDKVHALIS